MMLSIPILFPYQNALLTFTGSQEDRAVAPVKEVAEALRQAISHSMMMGTMISTAKHMCPAAGSASQ